MRRKYNHISPVMEDLHWLPIWGRINYKVLLLPYKSLNRLGPQYLSDFLKQWPDCGTRSDHKNPQVGTAIFSGRTFWKAAPDLLNNIPDSLCLSTSVKQFKAGLKTFLCHSVYTCSC